MSTYSLFDKLIKWSVGLGLTATAANYSVFDVDGGERAVIFDRVRGVRKDVYGEGMHFVIPWFQKYILFDIRTKPRNIAAITGSRDMQSVSLTLRVLSRPDIKFLPDIFSRLGQDYDEKVLPSIGNEVLKSVVAQFDASELISQREIVSTKIREELIKRANEFHILLEDVSLTHVTFGRDFTKAVEEKQIAQQEAERAKYIVKMAEHEKEAAIIRAEAEAHAAKIISDSISASGAAIIRLREIEASREIATLLSECKNISFVPSGATLLLNLPTP